MKTIRMSVALASMAGAATLFLVVPVSMSASPGAGWDEYFYTGESLTVDSSSYRSPAPSQEFDVANAGGGVEINDFSQGYMGTSMGSEASRGWDAFRAGDGDALP